MAVRNGISSDLTGSILHIEGGTSPEQMLWQAVVYRAFLDATIPTKAATGDTSKMTQAQLRDRATTMSGRKRDSAQVVHSINAADAWIRSNNKDYREVVSLAGMDPDFLRDQYIKGAVDRDILRAPATSAEGLR